MKTAIFFHSVFTIDGKPLPAAIPIVREQMKALKDSGLLDAADTMIVGVNGGDGDYQIGKELFPEQAFVVYHGTKCRNELRTIVLLEQWVADQVDEWRVLYFHAKGSSHPTGHDLSTRWRRCGMRHLVHNWRQCVKDLETVESVGVHFMTGDQTPPGQSIWAGNTWFSRSSYLKTLPSLYERARIKESGIDALESRFEAEVWHFNGERLPTLIDYHGPRWDPGKIGTCSQ